MYQVEGNNNIIQELLDINSELILIFRDLSESVEVFKERQSISRKDLKRLGYRSCFESSIFNSRSEL